MSKDIDRNKVFVGKTSDYSILEEWNTEVERKKEKYDRDISIIAEKYKKHIRYVFESPKIVRYVNDKWNK